MTTQCLRQAGHPTRYCALPQYRIRGTHLIRELRKRW